MARGKTKKRKLTKQPDDRDRKPAMSTRLKDGRTVITGYYSSSSDDDLDLPELKKTKKSGKKRDNRSVSLATSTAESDASGSQRPRGLLKLAKRKNTAMVSCSLGADLPENCHLNVKKCPKT